jgi:hypothetical protein
MHPSHGVNRALASVTVVIGAVYCACLGFGVQTTGDYATDFAPAMNALLGGHVGQFFSRAPQDGAGGSVLLRAPAALVGKVLFGSQLAIFRFGAVACLLAVGGLGLWLAREMRRDGRPPIARIGVILIAVLAPAVLNGIFFGHPEELLGAALCVCAVLLAGGGRPRLAGIVLGLAIINKPWAVLAAGPAFAAAPRGRFALCMIAGAAVGAWLGASYVVSGGPGNMFSVASLSPVAHPPDVWWPLARLARSPSGEPFYFAPRVIADHARQLAVMVSIPLSLVLWRRRGTPDQCLALLALLFLLRCLLDPSNHVYYQLPFVIALMTWEARASRTAPSLSLLAAGLMWLVFHTVSGVASLDVQFAAYLAIALPFVAILGSAVAGRPLLTQRPGTAGHEAAERPQVSNPTFGPSTWRGSRPITSPESHGNLFE